MKVTEAAIRRRMREIPTLPHIAVKVLSMVGDPELSLSALVDVIQYDQGLTVRILRLCNAPCMGLRQPVESLREAVNHLGTDTIKRIATLSSAANLLSGQLTGYGMDQGALWKHSVAVASGAQRIARQAGGLEPGAAFTAGLLHDVGKVVLHEFVGRESEAIRSRVRDAGETFSFAERAALGTSHSEAGAMLAERWSLPPYVVAAIRYQDAPSAAGEFRRVASCVNVANALAMTAGIGIGVDGLAHRVDPGAIEHLGLTQDFLTDATLALLDDVEAAQEMVAID